MQFFFLSLAGLFSAMGVGAAGKDDDSSSRGNTTQAESKVAVEPTVVTEAPVQIEEPAETVVVAEPVEVEEPVVVVEPVVVQEPVVIVEPVVVQEPVVTVEPVVAPEPAVIEEPTPIEVQTVQIADSWDVNVTTGRVTTLDLPGNDIASVKIVNGPDFGSVSINPDNTIAVVLTGTTELETQSFDLEITDSNGDVSTQAVSLNVVEGTQDAGWGSGEFYQLETDEDDHFIVEHGENHRVVHVSGDEDALTMADIAVLEGLQESDINGRWLEAHPEYGANEDMALAEDAGKALWLRITGTGTEPTSNWLLLESGFEYNEITLVDRGTTGESELNPVYIGAYGEGDKPVVNTAVNLAQDGYENIVIQGLEFSEKVTVIGADHIAFDDITSTGGFNLQNLEQITLRNTEITDLYVEEPRGDDTEIWSPHINRSTGIYLTKSEGALFENLYIDQIGWEDDYRTDLSLEGGQPPSIYSHNLYITNSVTDFTLRDSISSQGAGSAALIRAGGYIEDNTFIDSNAGVAINGGQNNDDGTRTGNYSLFNGNVITSGGHRTVDSGPKGLLTGGLDNRGVDTTIIDSIVTHLADPDSAAEQDAKTVTHNSYSELFEAYYSDLITYNWDRSTNNNPDDDLERNVEGLDTNVLDETTIQRFTSDLLGRDHETDPATISDLADYLRDQVDDESLDGYVDADIINAYFQEAFGIDTTIREDAATLRFIPSDLADGVRWDNRLNWDTEDLPGTQDGDSVDLGGNWVHYSGTTTLEDLTFGDHGTLSVNQGYLEIDGDTDVSDTGATLDIGRSGQFWLDGYDDPDLLTIDADGGRFANVGLFNGATELNVSENAQVILASDDAEFVLNEHSSLNIFGNDAKVGFDGDEGGTGVLLLADDATLSFTAQDGEIGTIREFYSGAFDGDNIQSGVNLGDSHLHLDLSGLDPNAAFSATLVEVDTLIGNFGEVTFEGLAANQTANVTVDYETNTVELTVGAVNQGDGSQTFVTSGEEATELTTSEELWKALTDGHGIYSEDPASGLDDKDGDVFGVDPVDL